MIVVAAKVTVLPGKRDAFIQAAQPCIAATRREEGCLFYTLYGSTENENQLLYYEQWTSRDALQRHLESAHMAAFGTAIAGIKEGELDVTIYDAKTID